MSRVIPVEEDERAITEALQLETQTQDQEES